MPGNTRRDGRESAAQSQNSSRRQGAPTRLQGPDENRSTPPVDFLFLNNFPSPNVSLFRSSSISPALQFSSSSSENVPIMLQSGSTTPAPSSFRLSSTTPTVSSFQSSSTTPAVPLFQSSSTTPAVPLFQSSSTIGTVPPFQSSSTTPAVPLNPLSSSWTAEVPLFQSSSTFGTGPSFQFSPNSPEFRPHCSYTSNSTTGTPGGFGTTLRTRLATPAVTTASSKPTTINTNKSLNITESKTPNIFVPSFICKPPSNPENQQPIKNGLSSWTGEKIGVDELFEMAVNGETLKVLLIHCQEKHLLNLRTIKKFECFPVYNMLSLDTGVPNQNRTIADRFTSKSEIVQFLAKNLPNVLEFLNAPGFYKHIIVLDEGSTLPFVKNKTAVFMLELFSKWNENTDTLVRFLDGGFAGVVSHRPSLLDREQPSAISRTLFQSHVFELSDCIIPPFPEPSNNAMAPRAVMNKQPITTLSVYVNELKLATEMATNCLKCQRAVISLNSLKLLVENEHTDVADGFVDNQIPEAVKCPVCTEIFTLEIFQCANGHSICSTCSGGLANCPVCREHYKRCKIRNRTLETLIVTAPDICCPFQINGCLTKLKYNEVVNHLKNCSFRQKNVLNFLKANIMAKENSLEIIRNELDIANNDLAQAEAELLWKKDTTNPSDSAESLKWMQIVLEWKRNFETMKVALATSVFMNNALR